MYSVAQSHVRVRGVRVAKFGGFPPNFLGLIVGHYSLSPGKFHFILASLVSEVYNRKSAINYSQSEQHSCYCSRSWRWAHSFNIHSTCECADERRLFKDIWTLLLNVRVLPKSAKLEASLSRKVLFEQRPKAITSPWSVFQKPNKTSCSGDVP